MNLNYYTFAKKAPGNQEQLNRMKTKQKQTRGPFILNYFFNIFSLLKFHKRRLFRFIYSL